MHPAGRIVGRILVLTAIWVLLWGRLSAANVLSGLLVAGLIVRVAPLTSPRLGHGPLRPLAALRLAGFVAGQLVVSNAVLTREILRRRSQVHTGIVRYELRVRSPRVATLVANVLALTPGTLPVELADDGSSISVHVLHLDDPGDVRRKMAHLERLATNAIGNDDDRRLVLQPDQPDEPEDPTR